MNIKDYKQNGVVVILLEGTLLGDTDGTPLLDLINGHIQQGEKNFVVDMGDLRHMNSSGLGILINALNKVRSTGGELLIANTSDAIKKLFIITKLNSIFTLISTIQEGLEKLKS